MGALFFLFASSFPRSRPVVFQNERSRAFILILPLFLTYLLLFSNDFVSSVKISATTINSVNYGSVYWLVVSYLAIFLGGGFAVLYDEYRKTSVASEKRDIKLVWVGTFIAAFFGLLGDAVLIRALGFGDLKLASVFILFSCIIMSYVSVKHKIFVIKPVSEESISTKPMFSAEIGKEYFFNEKNEIRRRAFRMFADQVKHDKQGLVVSTFYPEQVRRVYRLEKTPLIWLTESVAASGEKFKPKEIDALNRSVCLFLERATKPVLLIEGIKILVVENGADKVIELLNAIGKKARETNAVVFFSLKEKEVSFLELFNGVNSLKLSLKDLEKKFFSHELSEEAFFEMVMDTEEEIIEMEAELKLTEEEMLGKLARVPEQEQKRLLLEKSIQIIKYRMAKHSLDERVSVPLLNKQQKELVAVEQQMKKRNLIEKY